MYNYIIFMGINDENFLTTDKESYDTTTLKGRIRFIRGKKSQTEFSKLIGIDRSAITRFENGQTPSGEFLLAIATKTDWNIYWLATGEGRPIRDKFYQVDKEGNLFLEWNKQFGPNSIGENSVDYKSLKEDMKIISVYGKIAAGTPISMWNNEEYKISISHPALNKNFQNFYGFVVHGDSMSPEYNDGDIVIAAEFNILEMRPRNKDVVVTLFDSDPDSSSANIKIINWINSDEFILKSMNPHHLDTMHHLKTVRRMFKVYLNLSPKII